MHLARDAVNKQELVCTSRHQAPLACGLRFLHPGLCSSAKAPRGLPTAALPRAALVLGGLLLPVLQLAPWAGGDRKGARSCEGLGLVVEGLLS